MSITTSSPARWLLWVAASLLAACASPPLPPRAAAPGSVSVTFADPAQFSDARASPRALATARQRWLDPLGQHLAERAALALPLGERLQVRITDLQRAGRSEPWRGPAAGEVRIVRDIYPPRIDLDFQRLAADGRVLQQGQRQLRDLTFLMRPGLSDGDPLVYEKRLLDDWVRKEFGPPG